MSNGRSELLTAALINTKFVGHITPCILVISSPTFMRKFGNFLHGSTALTTGRQEVRPKRRKIFASSQNDIFQTNWTFRRALDTVTMESVNVAHREQNVKF